MPLKSTKEKKIRYKKFLYSNRFLRPWRPQSFFARLKQSRPIAKSPHRGSAVHPVIRHPSRFFTTGALCASSWKCRGWKENKRSTDNGFGSRLCWWRCIVARHCCGPVIVSLFCDRSQGGVPRMREPRPRSLGTFAIIRKNDRSTIKPASKGARPPLSPSPFSPFSLMHANQEEKEGDVCKVSGRNFCHIDFTRNDEAMLRVTRVPLRLWGERFVYYYFSLFSPEAVSSLER